LFFLIGTCGGTEVGGTGALETLVQKGDTRAPERVFKGEALLSWDRPAGSGTTPGLLAACSSRWDHRSARDCRKASTPRPGPAWKGRPRGTGGLPPHQHLVASRTLG